MLLHSVCSDGGYCLWCNTSRPAIIHFSALRHRCNEMKQCVCCGVCWLPFFVDDYKITPALSTCCSHDWVPRFALHVYYGINNIQDLMWNSWDLLKIRIQTSLRHASLTDQALWFDQRAAYPAVALLMMCNLYMSGLNAGEMVSSLREPRLQCRQMCIFFHLFHILESFSFPPLVPRPKGLFGQRPPGDRSSNFTYSGLRRSIFSSTQPEHYNL